MVAADVRAKLKSILVFGDPEPRGGTLSDFVPADAAHFGFSAQLFIGTSEDDLADSFDITVCSPSWLAEKVADGAWDRFRGSSLRRMPGSVAPGASLWFMRRWDKGEFLSGVQVVLDEFSPGPDWGTVASRIGRLIPWEFDYKYDRHTSVHTGEPFPPI